jgi:ribonuclease E
MPKQIIIAEQHRIGAVFWEDQIQELVVATGQHQVSDIYLGVVENVLPGIDAAFVNIGDPSRNGFIHVTDLGPLRLKRSSGAITELLAPQQKVLVQIMKEPTGNKGPRLTGNISLPGRYVVLMPFGKGVNLSRRIRSEAERNRLRAVAVLAKPAGMGLLVRTEAEGKTEDAILEDLEMLQKQWEAIQQDANSTRAPALLNRDDDFIQRVLRDMYSSDVNRIVVDSDNGVKRVKQNLASWNDGRIPYGISIDRHRERQPILEYFRVNAAIRESLKPRVDLPSGGYIIIEPTEALTVIDVNSGSFTRSTTSRETVLWTNCEAATEIARQLRLRNIAGVIIVDFIDMDYRKDQLQVLEHFNKQLRVDKARPQIAQLSELGLVELTRKRQGQNIYELFGQTCPTCGGLGHLAQLPGEHRHDELGEIAGISLVSTAPQRESRSGRGEGSPRHPSHLIARHQLSPAENWDGFSGQEEEVDRFNLVNHPSYQEQAGLNKKRRRRLGRIDSLTEGMRQRESLPRSTPRPTPSTDLSRSFEGETYPVKGHRPTTPFSPVRTGNEVEQLTPEPPVEQYAEVERERPGKPQRVKPTRPTIEPPEVVAIEMTDLEKETYAWMGVSPLVKLGRELANPKTAIINVVPPGTLPPEIDSSTDVTIVSASDRTDIETVSVEVGETPVTATEFAIQVSQDMLATTAPTDQGHPDEAIAVVSEESGEEVSSRRRRRRSSATVD